MPLMIKVKFIFAATLMLAFFWPGKCCLAQEDKPVWQREFSAGFNQATGNTQNSQISADLNANRKTSYDEWTVKGSTFYSSQNKKMDGQKHAGALRYAFSFWQRRWYNFYKFAAEHDKFAKIDYRLIPSTGVGYWFSDAEDIKFMMELGFGAEHTDYTDSTKRKTDTIVLPRAFFQKKVFADSTFEQDVTLFFNLSEGDEYRLRSETRLNNPLSDKILLRLSFVDEFDSNPPQAAKKNDTRTILSLVYSF
ncbi:MAG: DUF481 domain-containing protein [Candidatus Omnitrophica bacterium]|nr:DUF481 domain-containing protein [Candidatus Omnitrophota bacterium]